IAVIDLHTVAKAATPAGLIDPATAGRADLCPRFVRDIKAIMKAAIRSSSPAERRRNRSMSGPSPTRRRRGKIVCFLKTRQCRIPKAYQIGAHPANVAAHGI